MEVPISVVYLLIALLVGGAVGVLLGYLLGSKTSATHKVKIDTLDQRVGELQNERDVERARADELTRRLSELSERNVVDRERLSWLNEAERKLKETFEALASRALRHSTHALSEQNREQLRNVIDPLNSELKKLDQHVRTLEEKREGAYQGVVEQVRMISEQYRSLQHATTSLDQALRAPNIRGRWGEVQLRRIVELAGMAEHVDFDEQTSSRDHPSGGRPDMVVYLPSNAILPVDAKAPMKAYLESHEAATPELAAQAIKRHAQAMRSHVQSLAQKAYWNQFDTSPEFVVMLVPYESGLAAAFSHDPTLLEFALSNRVVIAAPASLLALLRVVAYGWMQIELSRNADAIAAAGRDLLDRLRPFTEHLNKLGATLDQAVERFNDAAGSYEHRVLPGVRRLQELGASSSVPQGVKESDKTTRHIRSQGEEQT